MQEFVEDWLLYNAILGEGAYGEVRLLINKNTDEKVACKIIDLKKYKDAESMVTRETTIHRMLDHPNIIKFFGRRNEAQKMYLFLEYAAGGELFQMIEPDVGMSSKDAHRYLSELLDGVKYLHSKGIAHRDIKPENLLIDYKGVLKISDFGMATIFRMKGKERKLDKRCGTKPYLAPEVLDMKSPYRAQPADLWSCGIVFVAMLTGELPWAEPSNDNEEFINYKKDNYISNTPWSKLGNTALSLVKNILTVDPETRYTLNKILNHPWMKFDFKAREDNDVTDSPNVRSAKRPLRYASMVESETRRNPDCCQVTLSQPTPVLRPSTIDQLVREIRSRREPVSFSQPTINDDLFIGPSEIQFTQSSVTKETFNKLIKRMTRFYVNSSHEITLELLCSAFENYHFNWSTDPSGVITIITVDEMKNQLIFKVNLIDIQEKLLIDFRLSKGCGLEFKKKFLKIRKCLKSVIVE